MKDCPCGCGGTVKAGKTYAASGCASRLPTHRMRRTARHEFLAHVHRRAHNPTVSWWVAAPRDAFMERVRREQHRMALAEFGVLHTSGILAADDPALRRTRRNRLADDTEVRR